MRETVYPEIGSFLSVSLCNYIIFIFSCASICLSLCISRARSIAKLDLRNSHYFIGLKYYKLVFTLKHYYRSAVRTQKYGAFPQTIFKGIFRSNLYKQDSSSISPYSYRSVSTIAVCRPIRHICTVQISQ